MIYFDNNASTRPDPRVVSVVCDCLAENYGNPSSGHLPGRQAREAIEAARYKVARLIGAQPDEIFFTSGGTESNNIALLGASARRKKGHIISSVIEHPAVINPLKHLMKQGFEVTFLPVDADGLVEPGMLAGSVKKETFLITIMHANNELGTIEPIKELADAARSKNPQILFHTDAAQSVGKIPASVSGLGVDMLSIAAHKFYGPKGIGALYIKKSIQPSIENILFGAGHECGLRPGTENTPLIAGLGLACELAQTELPSRVAQMEELGGTLLKLLKEKIPGLKLNAGGAPRLPNTLNVRISGADAQKIIESLKDKLALSAGAACHEGGEKRPSAVLKAIGLSDADAFSSLRISLGRYNTGEEVKEAAELLQKAVLQQGPEQ